MVGIIYIHNPLVWSGLFVFQVFRFGRVHGGIVSDLAVKRLLGSFTYSFET